jgi:hypothetical protein
MAASWDMGVLLGFLILGASFSAAVVDVIYGWVLCIMQIESWSCCRYPKSDKTVPRTLSPLIIVFCKAKRTKPNKSIP